MGDLEDRTCLIEPASDSKQCGRHQELIGEDRILLLAQSALLEKDNVDEVLSHQPEE
jgi:hypothetical protein